MDVSVCTCKKMTEGHQSVCWDVTRYVMECVE